VDGWTMKSRVKKKEVCFKDCCCRNLTFLRKA